MFSPDGFNTTPGADGGVVCIGGHLDPEATSSSRQQKVKEEQVWFEDLGEDVQEIIIELLASIIENKVKDHEGVKK